MDGTSGTEDRAAAVRAALAEDTSLAADVVLSAYTEDEQATSAPPPADAHLFTLRDYVARVTGAAAEPVEVFRTAVEALTQFREDAAELARLAQAMDEHLSRGGELPTEWRPEDTTEPTTASELALRAAFQAGASRGIYVSIAEGLTEWAKDVPLDEDRYVSTALELGPPRPIEFVEPEPVLAGIGHECSRACSEGHTYAAGCVLAPVNAESSWRPTGHETTFPCRVHVRVTYRDGTDAYYPVPDGDGWTVNTVRREVVIGKGLGRIHVPLDVVWSYSPEACHGGYGVREHEAGPTARGDG